jgi:gamma-glutamylcyclotransferase (GGCT)/AIG2-like uncharacterized protein YtfP
MHLVFVYGTLRLGGVRELSRLFPAAQLIGNATICGALYDFGAYPGLRASADGALVHGEVYGVDDAALREMDSIERIADELYLRTRVFAAMRDKRLRCWAYEVNPAHFALGEVISGGDWIAHAAAKGALPVERWPDAQPIRHGQRL